VAAVAHAIVLAPLSGHIAMFMAHYVPPTGYGVPGSPYWRTPQGKVAELRLELNSGGKKDKNHAAKKIALKKIVANMTMSNNDMVALFPDIVGCMEIPSLEIKKMLVLRSCNQRSLRADKHLGAFFSS
jgi:AP-2 complex subunit beta-1